ncbi:MULTISPECIES: DNA polymerase III subunit beta [Deinococcus]|jgi:DNA polymerase III, beta subunit (EC 2.7.7.7)|nr:DNA polymerase III subunit beta [Deinococcus radiodurans]ANC70347.1 DNA polymerase III subunit beta [Deinococcus radiodurans R1 = ATCC 13939 = DSM 20539]QEM71986.1 DNA polymerase III subunit beta [Deinococcus radiodurans]QIP28260.1 DNA polymerase III subunit beta [Deinococcus radiodurans]QIP30866.1 DNA polymerase III subunit beta [Deinococcus radiodurans]UDK99217.1 DNA polymerase III subunit beta [Deinococcus radiodurans R1 = ATCC 13939 = DSM 20539]
MKANVTKKTLNEGLGLLERVIPSRSSNPLLTALKVETSEGGLTLSGTNLEIDLSCFVPAEVQQPENFVVPAHLFAQIVRNLGGELVELELSGQELSVRSGGSDFKLQTGDIEAYPPLSFPAQADVSLDGGELSRAFSSVRYAASNEAFQAVFRGIKLEHHGESARVVASDGYRVAIRDFPASGDGKNLIIPARSVDELIRVLKDGEARFTYGDGMLTVTTDRVKMNLKLLDGDFPDYERVIPKDIKLQVTLPATALKEAVNRVAVLADKNANNRVEFLVSEGTLRLAAEGDYGRAQDTLSVTQGGTEQAMSLAFNARHVLDALGPIDGDAELLFSGSTSPAIFRAVGGGGGYMAVMVTLRV